MYGIRFRQVEALSHWDGGETTVEIKRKPWLTEWDCRILPQVQEGFHPREMGYCFLEHRPESNTDVYARPFLVWLYLWLCLRVRGFFWGVVQGLYRHDIIHFRTPETMRIRWRDLGLGSNPGKRGCWWWPRKEDPWTRGGKPGGRR